MKIGIAGPVSLKMLASYVNHGDDLPSGYLFAPMATWVEELLRRGHHVSIFTLAPEISQPQSFNGRQLNIHIGRYRAQRRARDFFKQEQHDLLDAMQKNSVDVLHAHWTYEFALAALNSGTPTLVTAHDAPLAILKINRDPYRLVRVLMAWQVCKYVPTMTAVSSYIEKHFRQFFGCKQKIHIIPNGVSPFVFDLKRSSYKQIDNRKIVFASNLTGWAGRKNGQVLVKAFAQARRQYPDCELWMFGHGHGNGEAAQVWAEHHELAQGIRFRGQIAYVQLLRELSENVDVLVHPALEESFSMAVAEAMALGIPVIGGKNSGAVPDTLGTGGLLANVLSVNELASAMLRLIEDAELREELGKNGRGIAIEKYRLSKVAAQYENLYSQLLNPIVNRGNP